MPSLFAPSRTHLPWQFTQRREICPPFIFPRDHLHDEAELQRWIFWTWWLMIKFKEAFCRKHGTHLQEPFLEMPHEWRWHSVRPRSSGIEASVDNQTTSDRCTSWEARFTDLYPITYIIYIIYIYVWYYIMLYYIMLYYVTLYKQNKTDITNGTHGVKEMNINTYVLYAIIIKWITRR